MTRDDIPRSNTQMLLEVQALERTRLRAQQATAVMPLIGPLLDAWECCSQSVRSEHPELDKQLRRINLAMEDAGDERPNEKGNRPA